MKIVEWKWGHGYPEYSVKLRLMPRNKLSKIEKWLTLNIYDWFQESKWFKEPISRRYPDHIGPVAYDIFYFKYEEDKVKFILRWL